MERFHSKITKANVVGYSEITESKVEPLPQFKERIRLFLYLVFVNFFVVEPVE